MNPPPTPTLVVRDLSVRYGNVHAVRGVSFDVRQGEILGILGPNGAGKSSILGAIAGTVSATSSDLRLDGQPLGNASIGRRTRLGVSMSPEGRGLLANMTVEDNLVLGAYSSGRMSATERDSRLAGVVDLFPVLADRQPQHAGTLSGGEAAMLSIGRALMGHPRLLLLDEPTLGLAPLVAAALFGRLGLLRARGISMLIVEQRAPDLLSLADRLLVLRNGEIQRELTTAEASGDELRLAYFGTASPPPSTSPIKPPSEVLK